MILPIVTYGHPVLRQKGARIETITPEITELIANMMDTMRDANGVGLAAQQIGRELQLTVIDVTGMIDRPSTLKLGGKETDPESHMPLVLMNPDVKPLNDPVAGPEGCLSFPELYGDITRPESVEVTAINEKGERINFVCGGLLARAVQHETDHLHGILFIDRMSKSARARLKPELDALLYQTKREMGQR
jgi:peptide deformylase